MPNPARTLAIDWTTQTEALSPFFEGNGGILVVTGSPTAACSTFIKRVRDIFRTSKTTNLTIQFNPIDATTREPDEILAKLELKLGVEYTPPASMFNVASGLSAEGNISLNSISVGYTPSAYDISHLRFGRAQKVIGALAERASTDRICIILYNWHEMPPRTVEWFWNEFIGDNLEELIETGVVFLNNYETEDGTHRHYNPAPDPHCLIALPSTYDDQVREQALTDIARYVVQYKRCDITVARAVADALLGAWSDRPSAVHAGLYTQILRWRKEN